MLAYINKARCILHLVFFICQIVQTITFANRFAEIKFINSL